MPRQSTKKRLYNMYKKRYLFEKEHTKNTIKYIEKLAEDVSSDSNNNEKKILDDIADILQIGLKYSADKAMLKYIESKRYLVPRKHDAPKLITKEAKIKFLLEEIDDDGFRNEMRMDRSSFDALYRKIKDHELYKSSPKNPQMDIKIQMAVVLDRLGTYGNGSSLEKIARRAGISSKVFMKSNEFVVNHITVSTTNIMRVFYYIRGKC